MTEHAAMHEGHRPAALKRHGASGAAEPGRAGGLRVVNGTELGAMTEAQLDELLGCGPPGLTVVPRVANAMGVTGVGIRAEAVDKGVIYTIIFNTKTYAPLGMNWRTVSGPAKGTDNGEVLQKIAIVNKPGQTH